MSNYLQRLGKLTAIFNWVCLGFGMASLSLGYTPIVWTIFVAQLFATANFFIRLYLELKRNEKRSIS